jgi:hypothetical protein
MDQSLNVNDLPDEILLHIQQQIVPEIKLPRDPESCYLNRYTPFAKALRCVCRRWKELVDLRSNYHTRITTAVIQLDLENDFCCHGRETFRTHLEQSRSLLAVLFNVIPGADWTEFGNLLVEECAQEIYHLVGYGGHLIQVEANFAGWHPDTLGRHLVTALQTLGPHTMLIHLNLQWEDFNFGFEAANDQTISVESCPALEAMLDSIPSLRKLRIIDSRIFEMEGTESIQPHLPPSLTSLSLGTNIYSFRNLLTPCTGLIELNLCIPSTGCDELYKAYTKM